MSVQSSVAPKSEKAETIKSLPTDERWMKCSVIHTVEYFWAIKRNGAFHVALAVKKFWTAVLEKTLKSPLDCKEIKPVNPKGNQPWIFTGGTDAEVPILWPPDVKSQLTGKEPDAGKDWRQEEKGTTEDEMVGWHHWLHGHEFEETLGDSEG